MLNRLCGGMQIEKRLETPNPRAPKRGKIAISDSEGVMQMAQQLMTELLQCVEQGFSPDAWPVRVSEFEGDLYKAPAFHPNLTVLYDAAE